MALDRLHRLLAETDARIREASSNVKVATPWIALRAEILAALGESQRDPARWARSARVAHLLHRGGVPGPKDPLLAAPAAASGTISGKVTDAVTGLPIASVSVDVYDAHSNWVTSGYSGGSGDYSVAVPPGTYYAKTYNFAGYADELYNDVPCAGWCDLASGTPISVTAGVATTGIDFALSPGGLISGKVTDAGTGLPIADVEVEVDNAQGYWVTYGYTDASGNYTIYGGLPTGTYYARTHNSAGYINKLYDDIPCFSCDVTTGTPIPVTLGSTTTGIDFALSLGGLISGQVTDTATGLPIPDVAVEVYDALGNFVDNGWSDASGNYTNYSGLPAGPYYARTYGYTGYLDEVYDDIPCLGWCDPTSGTQIPVTVGSTTTGIDFALSVGGQISGQVTDKATGLPIPDVEVEVYDALGNWVTYGYTDASGNYTHYAGLTTGIYYVRTWNSAGYINKLYDDIPCLSCDVTTGTPIPVTLGSTTTGIDFALSLGGRISGKVTDAVTGLPIGYVEVDLYDGQGNYVAYNWSDGFGKYTSYSGLPAGTYYAVTWNSTGYVDELYDGILCPGFSCDPTAGTPIGVALGRTTTRIDFALAKVFKPSSLTIDFGGNSVLEPGDVAIMAPAWKNVADASQPLTGSLTDFTGPGDPNLYSIQDDAADYGMVAAAATNACVSATGDCYSLEVKVPTSRPSTHWDATAQETLSDGEIREWVIHIGDSFSDVPRTNPFYRFVETLLHNSVTAGCSATNYCPTQPTTRAQMAVFVLKSKEGSSYTPPACGASPMFGDVPASSPFCRWIEELARRGVVSGCGGGNYCPDAAVSRDQMAVFVLRTLDPSLSPPACTTPMFSDVAATNGFCRWIEELARRHVVGGCGGGNYCPASSVDRQQMGVFMGVGFGMTLYGR